MKKKLFIFGSPVTDGNFNQVMVSEKQANTEAKRQESKFRKNKFCSGAIGIVFDADDKFNVSVGFVTRR